MESKETGGESEKRKIVNGEREVGGGRRRSRRIAAEAGTVSDIK